jgi:GNAT superfamily N-acetyltransferase
MIIRCANSADCHAIAHVQIEGWRTTYRGIVPDEYLDAMSPEVQAPQWSQILQRPNQVTLVVEDEAGTIVAFANGGPERTGRVDYRGELYAIYLLESVRRQGLGTRLFQDFILSLAEFGIDGLMVWVLADNAYRQFYESLGGTLIGERRIELGGRMFREVAYGWDRVVRLTVHSDSRCR